MSFKTKEGATARAKEVRAMMRNPKQWTAAVHQNMGWHWSLKCHNVSLYESNWDSGQFHTLISDDPNHAHYGCGTWSDPNHRYPTPQAAVDGGVKIMKSVINEVVAQYRDCAEAAQNAVTK